MNFFTSSKIPFTSKDLETIVSKSLEQLKLEINDDIYITNSKTAVVSHSQAKVDIEKKLNGDGRTSIRLLSADPEVDLNSEVVEEIVKSFHNHSDWYLKPGDNIIFTKGEVEKLKRQLIDVISNERVVKLVDFCGSNRVDSMFVKWLLGKQHELVIKDDVIINNDYYNQLEQALIEKLNQYQTIVNLEEALNEQTPSIIQPYLCNSIVKLSKDSSSIHGTFDRQGIKFTPECYRLSLQNDIILQLNTNGFISQQTVRSALIKDVSKLIDDLRAYNLSSFVITGKFIENIASQINNKLDVQNGWVDLSEIEYPLDFDSKRDQTELIENHLFPIFLPTKNASYHLYNNRYLMSITLEKQLKKDALTYYENLATTTDSQALSSLPQVQQSADNSYEIKQAVLNHSKQPTSNDIVSSITSNNNYNIPNSLLSSFISLTAFDKDIRTTYLTTLTEQVTKLLQKAQTEAISKLSIYINGIKTLSSDTKLQTKLTTELIDYTTSNLKILNIDPTTISTLDDLDKLTTTSTTITPDSLVPVKQKLISTLESQLKKATDPALILHLAVVIHHGRTISLTPPGLLRTNGKNVPKILNLLQTLDTNLAPAFNDLKTAIVAKKPKPELKLLADQVRNLVL